MTDVLVIGGGIIGLTTAHYLLEAGLSVKVLERGYYGKESSWAGAGILSPLYPWKYSEQVNKLSQQSQVIYPKFCQEILEKTGVDSGYQISGLLIKDDYKHSQANNFLQTSKIYHTQTSDGLLLPEIAQVRNPWFLKGLKKLVSQQGGKLLEQQDIQSFVLNNKRVLDVKTHQEKHIANHIVICSGAWSSRLLNLLPISNKELNNDIFPIKGQMLLFEFPEHYNLSRQVPHIILADNKYLVPRTKRILLVGATYEQAGFDKSLNKQNQQVLSEFTKQYIPNLSQAKLIKQWVGLRPATHSGKIHITRLEPFSNLYINAGHFSNGINTALASAKQIVEKIL